MTVEASQALVPALVRLMGELGSVYDLWLTLAPLVRDEAALALAPVYTPAAEPVDQGALLRALTPHAAADSRGAHGNATTDPAGPAQAPADNYTHARAGRGGQTGADGGPQRAGGTRHGVPHPGA